MFVAVSITDTVLSPLFATYTPDPSGVTATPMGVSPTGTVVTTVFVDVSTMDRALSDSSVMYASGAALAPAAPASTTTPAKHSVTFSLLIRAPHAAFSRPAPILTCAHTGCAMSPLIRRPR